MKRNGSIIIPLVLVFLLSGCTSVSHYEKIDARVIEGDFSGGLQVLESVKTTNYQSKDRVLFFLNAGMLSHYAGLHGMAISLLSDAEVAIEEAFTKSISMEVSTFLVNDNTREYAGEDYEDIYLNVFKALAFYHQNSVESALVEIRRVNNKLRYLSDKYGTAITNAQKAAIEQSGDVPAFNDGSGTVRFNNSALARYLGMLFYRADGTRDSARIDRNEVRLAFANQPSVYTFPVPSTLDGELETPRGMARLNVVAFAGLSPIKTEEVSRIMLPSGNWIKFALPILQMRPSQVQYAELVLSDGRQIRLELIEDMAAVAAETFRQNAAFIYFKSVMRAAAKTAASAALGEQARKTDGEAGAFMLLASIGTQIYAEASEQADLRISRYFPGKALVTGIDLEPGTYDFSVDFYGQGGRLVHRQVYHKQEIRSDRLNLVEALCIR